jgi:hypothetical protein
MKYQFRAVLVLGWEAEMLSLAHSGVYKLHGGIGFLYSDTAQEGILLH